ncbi:hypothetical protein AMS68_005401 [Peltaster fructicola]|uniref:Uncharacterized protein n=1 Tax=Peltaster fructicola TaxID=286661 RepID=A0A6H0XYQ8_9PEZI|nr:hypothetical protein AMS68_005401 [Peltaster fructicola]
MCLINVKDEEEEYVPVRVKTVRRISRPPSPVRSIRRTVVERRSESASLGPLPPSIPPPARSEIPAPSVRSERPKSRAPSTRRARSAYVEVDEETSDSSESSVSRHTSHTRKTSKSRRTAPASEYSVHEKETRRERDYGRPREEYETYRYVEPPRSQGRGSSQRNSYYEQPRSSRDDYGRRVTIEDDYRRSSRQYRS